MAKLEDLKRGARVRGIAHGEIVTVVDIRWHGSDIVELTYKDDQGRLAGELLFRTQEAGLFVEAPGRAWSFDGDGALLRLVSEAFRIRLAYLFDPMLALHISDVEPLPHQITAVYEVLLPRQPLRFLLADDPGAGKTIMTGLLIRELIARGDLRRCLVCCPGNLVYQWQDELWRRFHLDFKIISSQSFEDAKSGNPYLEQNLVISRLDHMARNEEIQSKLKQTEWDLVVVDEAHKMSAHYFGNELKETKRYKLGQLLGSPSRTRHFLLLSATPHNGKDEDFQAFLALLDADRFEGKFRDGVHTVDASDLMRRLVKEQMLKFDGAHLFPERRAYTVNYQLSPGEAELYEQVTNYVRQEMNRADQLAFEGEGQRGNRIGFALTILQRRLASSPEAIYASLKRRRERLEKRMREEQLLRRGTQERLAEVTALADIDLEEVEDVPEEETVQLENQVLEQATAARTIAELEAEIVTLRRLEILAGQVRASGTDKKWEELSRLLQESAEMFDPEGRRRKLILFSEHRDTLNYLHRRIVSLLGVEKAVVVIHGSMGREERRAAQECFTQDPVVQILVATDAAGEGINLQRAHLMVNYDLPWNPNRLEQRFGRIHRIGQEEVCHMWNLVAAETREGEVYLRLLSKLETERAALGGGVFDVLGRVFEGTELRELLLEAIRYGDQPEVRERLYQIIDQALDRDHLRRLLEDHALVRDAMDFRKVQQVRQDMERAEVRRLQPHFVRSYFLEAFRRLGGTLQEREPLRYEVTWAPAAIRDRDRQIGLGDPVLSRYERICFEKEQLRAPGKPLAELVCPGHPLLEATTDLLLERHRDLLKKGALLLDPNDPGQEVRVLVYLEHTLVDGRSDPSGNRRVVSRQLRFVELERDGGAHSAGYAPYLDYSPLDPSQQALLSPALEQQEWLSGDLEGQSISYAVREIVPSHIKEAREAREELVQRTIAAVVDRLTKEINHWDYRANALKDQELAGKTNAGLNSGKARQRADELQARLKTRLEELERERQVSSLPPRVVGGALVIPAGLLALSKGDVQPRDLGRDPRVEALAMAAIMEVERRLGREPRDVSKENLGYDIESSTPGEGSLRFLEVKGRVEGAATVTVTRNEILTALNKPDGYILALVPVNEGGAGEPVYVQFPFRREPDFAATSVNYDLKELMRKGGPPR